MLETHTHIESESIDVSDTTSTHHALAEIPLTLIDMDFPNTRTKLDTHVVDALAKSIASNGLINPITLNLKDDGRYSVVAGFTRYSAIQQLQFTHVQARVYEQLTSAQLLEISLSENTVRQDLSIAQQLQAVKRAITEIGTQDTATLATRLMWSKSHINSLLKVAKAPDAVLSALDEGTITLGHATYLVQLLEIGGGDIDQNTALIESTIEKIISEKWSVSTLKAKVVAKQIPLSLAKFDTTQTCTGCEFNSSTFGSLFDFDNDGGLCSKPSCFKTHSDKVFEDTKALAEERFGNVIALSTVADTHVRPISANELGDTQLTTCNTCCDNIAIINDSLTSPSYVDVKDGLCRNDKCYSKCANAHSKAQAIATTDTTDTTDTHDTDSGDTSTNTAKQDTTKQAKDTAVVNLGQCSDKQKLLSQQAMAQAMTARINDPDVQQLLITYAIQSLTNRHSNVSEEIKANPAMATGTMVSAVNSSYAILKDYLNTFDSKDTLEHNSPRHILLGLLANVADKESLLKASWEPTTQLPTYTIKAIIAICEESGFSRAFDAKQGEHAFKKISNGAKKALLEAINDFKWQGWADYYPQAHAKSLPYSTVTTTEE